jgi:phosphoribosylformylglycinamidine cyclo-ligase
MNDTTPSPIPAGGMTYQQAGVDIAAAESMLAQARAAVKRTHTPAVLQTLSDFGGLFALGSSYRDPVLVAGTDGVGTKLKIAFAMNRHDTIGQDLVAMCVDDVVVQGARPLFFLDYFATSQLQPAVGAAVIGGIAAACEQVGCALIGGETAELPGFYAEGEYDLAGFAVGVVERDQIIDGSAVQAGDVVLGLASSGLHSNGYSLARKVLLEVGELSLNQSMPELGQTVGEALLTPTRLYAADLMALLDSGLRPHALSHITGGGWPDNLSRVIPPGLCALCDSGTVPPPPLCTLIQRLGQVPTAEMYRTFNMGMGMALVVAPAQVDAVQAFMADRQLPVYQIGQIVSGDQPFAWA